MGQPAKPNTHSKAGSQAKAKAAVSKTNAGAVANRKRSKAAKGIGKSVLDHDEGLQPPTYRDIGITYDLASEAQTLAGMTLEAIAKADGTVGKSTVERALNGSVFPNGKTPYHNHRQGRQAGEFLAVMEKNKGAQGIGPIAALL